MAGAVQRLHGDSVTERVANTKSLNNGLAVIGAVLPVAAGIDVQLTITAIEGCTGKLVLPGIGISDGQCTGDGQCGAGVFADRRSIGTANHGTIVSAVDGDGQVMTGTIQRLDGDGINQSIAIAQRLNGGLTVAGAVIPGTARIKSH